MILFSACINYSKNVFEEFDKVLITLATATLQKPIKMISDKEELFGEEFDKDKTLFLLACNKIHFQSFYASVRPKPQERNSGF